MANEVTNSDDNARNQAKAQMECIAEMIERLQHCGECSEDFNSKDCEFANRFDTEAEFDDYHDEDEARQAIDEDPLSVQLRSGWYTPGETPEAEEFEILLCTGGTAVRIIGDIGLHGEPDQPRLQYQDWGTPWTEYFDVDRDVLRAYCQHFYFGE